MIKTNFDSSDSIAWETVRSKKSNDKPDFKHQSPKLEGIELNENYVPCGLRKDIDEILYSSNSTGEKIRDLNKKINSYCSYKRKAGDQTNWKKRLNIYVIHKSCKQNKHEIIASIIDNVPDYKIYSNAVSSTKSGNTCLFDAAYYGSDICINYLINRGANIHHKNKAGEDIYDLFAIGMTDAMKRYPNATEIVKARFDECIRLVKQEEENEKLPKVESKKVESEKKESEKVESEKEFREEYDFESLKEDLMKYIEKLDVCKRFINYLKKNKFTDLLVKVLDDEDMEDVLIDNPYLVKLI